MAGACTVCRHPERARIELALAHRVGGPQIAKTFNVSQQSVYRHRANHLPPQLMAHLAAAGRPSDIDLEALRKSESEGLLQHLLAQRGRLWGLAQSAEDLGDHRGAAAVHGRLIENLKLSAGVLGEIGAAARVTVNQLVVSPEYLAMRTALLRALGPHPEARRAVAAVLKDLEGQEPAIAGVPRTIEHQGAVDAGA